MAHTSVVLPSAHQPDLPLGSLIRAERPDPEAVPMDVVFIGGGPAGLAGAIELARLVQRDNEKGGGIGDVQIAVLEKAAALGEHSLSGAVVNPVAFRELFPSIAPESLPFRGPVRSERVYLLGESRAQRIPTPPTMKNHGNYVASLCEIVRWLGQRAEELGVNVFTGVPAESLLVDKQRVIGIRTAASGLMRDGQRGPSFTPPTDITAKVVVLSEGTRGSLTQGWLRWQNVSSENPQIYALGVKEIWETKRPLDAVIHTLGWPIPKDSFGGSFMYPLAPNLVALGLVVGMDYHSTSLDVHVLLQRMKLHSFFRQYLDGGEMVEWGAKTIPEGGYYALPARLSGDGLLIVGDAAGFVEVASLKGIHYAVQSGILAGRAIFDALKNSDTSSAALGTYDKAVRESFVVRDLYRRRNMRLAFQDGFYVGGFKAAVMSLTGGMFPGGRIESHRDVETARRVDPPPSFTPDGRLTFSKMDAVFKSGNVTRDDIPSHLIVGSDVPADAAELYTYMCPAGVYERSGDRLVVNPAN